MKKFLLLFVLLVSTFALTGASAPSSPVMRRGIWRDECKRIWEKCYGRICIVQNRSEAQFRFHVTDNKYAAELWVSAVDRYDANKPGHWWLGDRANTSWKVAFVESRLDADCSIAFVPKGEARFNWDD